ncbi:Uncharacterised protein [Vibrio cholerae]|uniref:Uncharacterized protein n=1 Tax=Vibrio cholerae TaxID=666 RepID=A0A656ALV5_VIBCL|nr:Uncharacterised protein [Vibrio cholerae]CSB20671.1 Uncharacterised protein [Vibrio cholerae]CSB27915.1 Uncharacterised protein [Vibrio cholerae]CSB85145.1 Uncharacterised protein [Vibrio cholerae]CSD19292.1 Uncharacterised protein [Vibrio cholerae]
MLNRGPCVWKFVFDFNPWEGIGDLLQFLNNRFNTATILPINGGYLYDADFIIAPRTGIDTFKLIVA